MNDTTWFWEIVDARGLSDVSSDEFVALNELISKAGQVDACAEYLKDGETPRERMDRDHADVLGLMKLLAQSREALTTAESERDELLREKERLGERGHRDWGAPVRDGYQTKIHWIKEYRARTGATLKLSLEAYDTDVPMPAALSSASQGSGQNLADANSKSPAPSSQSERIAVLAEREACAQSISSFIQAPGNFGKSDDYLQGFAAGANYTAERNAAAIRARAALAPLGEE